MFVTLVGAVVVTAVSLCFAQPPLLTQVSSYSPQNLLYFQRNSYNPPLSLYPAAKPGFAAPVSAGFAQLEQTGSCFFQAELLGFPADSQP